MIEVLFRDTGPAVIVGEADDLEGISMLRLNAETGEITLELANADQKPLGQLTEPAVAGLLKADTILVAGLFKNTMAWALEVDLNDFKEPPRKVTQIELTALIQSMADSGYYGEAATEAENKARDGRQKRRQRRTDEKR